MRTQGVLQQIHTECAQLTDAIACQQKEISTYRAKLGPDPNFGRRVITAIMWKITLGPKTCNLHPMIERLKTSLHLVMNIIHLEAVQHGLQEEMTHLKEEIRGLRNRLPQIAQPGTGAPHLFPGPWAHPPRFYLAGDNDTLNSLRHSVVSIFSSTSLATTRGSQMDTDDLGILAESMVETGQVPALPAPVVPLSQKSSRATLRPNNSGRRIRRYGSTVSILDNPMSDERLIVPRYEAKPLSSLGSVQDAFVSEARSSEPNSDPISSSSSTKDVKAPSSPETLLPKSPTTREASETHTVPDPPRRARPSYPERPPTEIVQVQIRNFQGQWQPVKAILDPHLYIPNRHASKGPEIYYHGMVSLRVLVEDLGWPKDPRLEETSFQELPRQHKFRWGFARNAGIGRMTLTWRVDESDDEVTRDCIITNEDPCDEGLVLKRLPGTGSWE
ncbi:hypothetical protein B0T20DRAFT_114870 [Sordaria brevicollis]|uniref:Uncharacterized protein n=1 Tax=Sordaria brevicollis TaxID=83679 RepID=A0AAE0PKA6_SORBR|nr:hypothetical protein B0T20DRAFT_114870 [Sordaria brevicollis]